MDFRNNIKTEEQLKGILANTKTYSNIPLFLGVDEEGERVARIGNSYIDVQTFNDIRSIGTRSFGGNPERVADMTTVE